VVTLALSPLSWADTDVGQSALEGLAKLGQRPEAIAVLAAFVQDDDTLPPGRIEQSLHALVDDKRGAKPGARVDPLVKAQASYVLSLEEDRKGAFAEAEKRRKGLGFVSDAWVLGPFDSQGRSGLGHAFPVEDEGGSLDPRDGKSYPGKDHEVAWRHAPAEAFVQGAFFLDALLRPNSDGVAYVLTYLTSNRDQWAALRIGSPGPVKAWLGGVQVFVNDVVRPANLDQDAASIYLRRGTTALLLKTVITRGEWHLFVRLTDPAGQLLTGVRASADVPSHPVQARPAPAKLHPVRELGKILRERALQAAPAEAAQAWLDDALFLALVQPADSDLKAIEAAANRAVPAPGTKLTPTALAALHLLGRVAREEDDRRSALERALAEPLLSGQAQTVQERALLLAELGNVWRRQHRDDNAMVCWQKAVALDPACVPAHLALAREEQRVGMTSAALLRLTSLPSSAQVLPLVQDAQADLLASLGRRRESEAVHRAIYEVRRSDTSVLHDLAAAARARGDLDEAGRYYAEVRRWRPDLSSPILDYATVSEGRGDTHAAETVLTTAIARLPDDPTLHEELGRLQARLGQGPAAVASMERALALRPQNPTLRRYMQSLAAASKVRQDSHAADDLVAEYAAQGESVAREVLFGSSAPDDAAAEVLLDRSVVRVHTNGLSERFVQRLVHVRSDRAARENQETWVRFEPGRQEVEIRLARILRRAPDGRLDISEATGRDERELSEPWYGLYYDSRAQIVAFENLRAGDVLEVQYTVSDVSYSNELADYFGDFDMIADVLPVRTWDYTLIAPTKRAFYFNQPRLPGLVRHNDVRGGNTIYRFAAAHVPRVESEPAMPGFAQIAPYLHISTYRNWEEVGHWYWNLVSDQMQDDGTLKKAAVQATVGLTTTLDKVKAIHRLVVQNTRYVGLEFGIHGYKPYKSCQVFLRRFGDCKDKATLLMALLRAVGVDSELVLLRTRRGGTIDTAPASLAVFDHAIAYVPALDRYVDGTAEFSGLAELPTEDQDTMALRVSSRGTKLVRTPLLPSSANQAVRTWSVDVQNDGGAVIREDLTIAGQSAHEWREHYQTPGERMERYGKVWNGKYAGAQLQSVVMEVSDRNQPVVVQAVVKVPRLGDMQAPGELHLPTSSREADFTRTYARLGERHWPLVLGFPWQHREQVGYRLPIGARIVRVPASRNIQSNFGTFTLSVESSDDGLGLTCKSALYVQRNRIDPEDYAAFRAFLRDIDAALADAVVVDLGRTS
jgi:transglutaminase-like putative cysteine protease/Flp pilus assembly protein TadD